MFFIKLTLPPSLIYGLQMQKIRALNRLSPKNVGSFMRVSTVDTSFRNMLENSVLRLATKLMENIAMDTSFF